MKRITLALTLLALSCGAAAQTSPNFTTGQVPTATQWNNYFAAKQDVLGNSVVTLTYTNGMGVPVNTTLGGMSQIPGGMTVGGNIAVTNLAPPLGLSGMSLNYNAAPPHVLPHRDSIQINGGDGESAGIYVDNYSGLRPIINLRGAQGTGASPTGSLAGDELGRISGRPYAGTGFGTSVASIAFFAGENATLSAQGGWAGIRVSPLGTVAAGDELTPAISVGFTPNGGEIVGTNAFTLSNPNTALLKTDPGNGFLQVLAGIKLTGTTPTDTLSIIAPSFTGAYTLKLPAGSTDFSATGGAHQVVEQSSAGAALTVAQLSQSDVLGAGVSTLYPASNSTTAVQVLKADGTTVLANFDTTNLRLGIGTATPSSELQIYNAAAAASLTMTGDGQSGVLIAEQYNTGTGAPVLNVRKARGSLASPTAVNSGDINGAMRFSGYDGAAFQITSAIEGDTGTLTGANNISGLLKFSTRPTGASAVLAEAMRLTPNGGLAIGTATFNATDPGQGSLAIQNNIAFGGILTSPGGVGVTCAGSPTSSFATNNGVVIHC